MSDPLLPVSAWPAARPTGIRPIQHPAWEAARNAILDLAAEGPVTAVIVGEPGTGKSWLLRELASSLGDHGFPTMMLMQGDLPMALSSGAALLVDEASLMAAPKRAEMSAQEHGVVVLAAAEWPGDDQDAAASSPVVIPLRTLEPDEIADFAAEWLERSDLPAAIMDTSALSRLGAESGGRVGTMVHLLGEAAANWTEPPIAVPDEGPAEIVADPVVEPAITPPLAHLALPRRRSVYRPVLAGSAIAAMIVLGWALVPAPPPAPLKTAAQSPAPAPVIADATVAAPAPPPPLQSAETSQPPQTAMVDAAPPEPVAALKAPLPPLRYAETSAPALVGTSGPAQSSIVAPAIVAPPALASDATTVPVELHTTPLPAIAVAPAPPVLNTSDPSLIAAFDNPALATLPAPSKPFDRTGGPGLALVAQRGDTLARLYLSVYRDRRAPPYASVQAANPGPFKPGSIVVFPEPPGGWQRAQR